MSFNIASYNTHKRKTHPWYCLKVLHTSINNFALYVGTSPYTLTEVSDGDHSLVVRTDDIDNRCDSELERDIDFTIEAVAVRFILDTPRVDGNNLTVIFDVGAGVESLRCTLTSRPDQDCKYTN